jgi:hypothetical protein
MGSAPAAIAASDAIIAVRRSRVRIERAVMYAIIGEIILRSRR